MALKLKEEYKEWSIGGGGSKKVKLKNLCPSLYEEVYKSYPDFFTKKVEKIEKQIIIEDDTDTEI